MSKREREKEKEIKKNYYYLNNLKIMYFAKYSNCEIYRNLYVIKVK